MITVVTESGARKDLPDYLDPGRVVGLDSDGRIVVDPTEGLGGSGAYLFGLTLCCNAYDKGCEDGVYCRACYGGAPNADAGNYLWPAEDGSFPGLDPTRYFLRRTCSRGGRREEVRP